MQAMLLPTYWLSAFDQSESASRTQDTEGCTPHALLSQKGSKFAATAFQYDVSITPQNPEKPRHSTGRRRKFCPPMS